MVRLNFEAFRKSRDPLSLEGAYVFASDACDLCRLYEAELETAYGHRTGEWTVVETLLESDKEHLRAIAPEFRILPFTAVFRNGIPAFQRNGVLFASQMAAAMASATKNIV